MASTAGPNADGSPRSLGQHIAARLVQIGVSEFFGVPGGRSERVAGAIGASEAAAATVTRVARQLPAPALGRGMQLPIHESAPMLPYGTPHAGAGDYNLQAGLRSERLPCCSMLSWCSGMRRMSRLPGALPSRSSLPAACCFHFQPPIPTFPPGQLLDELEKGTGLTGRWCCNELNAGALCPLRYGGAAVCLPGMLYSGLLP